MHANPYQQSPGGNVEGWAPHEVEGWALVEVARRLDSAVNQQAPARDALEVVRLNWRIWTIIQASLTEDDCPVPEMVRDNLISLTVFIDRRSVELISNYQPEKVQALININRQIGAGLLGNTSPDNAHTTPSPPVGGNAKVAVTRILGPQTEESRPPE